MELADIPNGIIDEGHHDQSWRDAAESDAKMPPGARAATAAEFPCLIWPASHKEGKPATAAGNLNHCSSGSVPGLSEGRSVDAGRLQTPQSPIPGSRQVLFFEDHHP